MLIVTSISVSLIAMLYIGLAFKVIAYRRQHKVSLGDGGNQDLNRAIRAHANLCEYAPIGLLLIACLEFNQAPILLTLPLAFAFIIGRYIHPLGIMRSDYTWSPRVKGMVLTLISIMAMAAGNLVWLLIKSIS